MSTVFNRADVRLWFIALALTTLFLVGLSKMYEVRGAEAEDRAWANQGKLLDEARDGLGSALAAKAARVDGLVARLGPALAEARATGLSPAEAMDAVLSEEAVRGAEAVGVFLSPVDSAPYAKCFSADSEGAARLLWDQSAHYLAADYAGWLEPLADGAGWRTFLDHEKRWMAQYAAPFYLKDAEGAERLGGVAFVRMDHAEVRKLLRAVDLGETGYTFLMTESGELIDHPLLHESQVGVTLFDVALREKDHQLAEAAERAILGDAPWISRVDPATGSRARIFFRPTTGAGWTLIGVSLVREVLGSDMTLRREHLHLVFSGLVVSFCMLGLLATLLIGGRERRLWVIAGGGSFLIVVAVIALWQGVVQAVESSPGQVRILDEGGLRTYLGRWEATRPTRADGGERALIRIPTGVYVQSLEFASANNVRMSGLIWQRMDKELPEDLKKGFILPEAVDIESEEVYRRPYFVDGKEVGEVVGTWFVAVLRQNFKFVRYPFDTKDVWIRIWPAAFDRDVMLVPDLEGYTLTNPVVLPGLDPDFVLAGWQPMASYFQYRRQAYTADMGLRGYDSQDVPELYFTIDVHRNFVDSFVSDLIPLLVVACLLFGVLLTVTTRDDRSGATGFNVSAVLGACLALVFVVVVAHIQLRTMLAGQPIVYLEWFYFAMYLAVVAVSLNGFLVTMPDAPETIRHGDNLIPRLLYWPILSGALLLVTLAYFYPREEREERVIPTGYAVFETKRAPAQPAEGS